MSARYVLAAVESRERDGAFHLLETSPCAGDRESPLSSAYRRMTDLATRPQQLGPEATRGRKWLDTRGRFTEGVSSDTPQRGATKPTQQSAFSDTARDFAAIRRDPGPCASPSPCRCPCLLL